MTMQVVMFLKQSDQTPTDACPLVELIKMMLIIMVIKTAVLADGIILNDTAIKASQSDEQLNWLKSMVNDRRRIR